MGMCSEGKHSVVSQQPEFKGWTGQHRPLPYLPCLARPEQVSTPVRGGLALPGLFSQH